VAADSLRPPLVGNGSEMDKTVEAQTEEARAALRGRILANRLVAVGVAVLVVLTIYLWFHGTRPHKHALRMTAGEALSHRQKIAEILIDEAAKHGLDIDLTYTTGSQDSLARIAAGELDVAMALGDYDFPDDNVREVAFLQDEALHLFVKPELVAGGIAGLGGKTISLSTKGSNTQLVARRLLAFVGLTAGAGYVARDCSHEELKSMPAEELPDAIFAISSLPWVEVGELLVKKHGYRLVELPFAAAAALRDPSVHDLVIPAYTYSIHPDVPEEALHTVGQRLLIVANRETPDAAIERLMTVLFESEFSRRARLPSLDATAVIAGHEFPLHEGARKYLHRNEPLIKADSIDKIENMRSFLVSAALALFLFWRWHRRRNMIGFETFIDAVSEIELAALAMDRDGNLDVAELRRMRQKLSEIKGQALEFQAEGVLSNEEHMVGFLTHVFDVRSFLDSLIALCPPLGPRPPADGAERITPAKMENT